jgi:hypothetical protein
LNLQDKKKKIVHVRIRGIPIRTLHFKGKKFISTGTGTGSSTNCTGIGNLKPPSYYRQESTKSKCVTLPAWMINLVLFKRDILFKKLRDYPFEQ